METAPAAGRERLITRPFLLVAGATMALFASFASLLPVLPRYADGPLDSGGVGVGLSIGAASVTALLFLPRMGRFADRHSRRAILLAGALVVAVTDASLVLATNLPAVVGIRLLSGIGEAAVFAAAIAVVNDLAPEHRRGEAVSLFTVASYSGLAVGPLLGEAALGDGRYDAVWLTAGGCAAVAALLALRLPDPRPAGHEPPEGGGWLLHREALLPGLILFASLFGFGGYNAFAALYALELGLDGAGPAFAELALIVLLVRALGAKIPDRLGPERTVRLSLTTLAAGLLVIAGWKDVPGLYSGTAIFALGQGLCFPAVMTLAIRRAKTSERGAVAASVTAFVDFALAFGAFTLGGVADLGGYRSVFLVSAAVAAAGLLALGAAVSAERRP